MNMGWSTFCKKERDNSYLGLKKDSLFISHTVTKNTQAYFKKFLEQWN